ncbi:MAG: aldo/keto reductase [Treponema sp.]|jgi:aryl-alcohol dehydrogenase-like predicted oxidoreductase|nr:aldo/keto reductase [Treponema sp.]
MEFIALGKTELLVSRTAFGAMSLDCPEIEAFGSKADEKACSLVHQAYDAGINFFDTAHSRPLCEKRLGAALHGIRQDVLLATKTDAVTPAQIRADLEQSLLVLETDTIDLYQLENPPFLPLEHGKDGIYSLLAGFRKQGVIRHFGVVTENLDIARQAVECGLYESVQISFNMLSGQQVVDFVALCQEREVGCIAMQPLNGGIVKNIPLAFGFLHQYEHVVPVWGVHTQEELQQILYFNDHPPVVDDQFRAEVEHIRRFFN